MSVSPKMSEIMKYLAEMCLINPKAIPSSEAVHAALLFAHVGWNRSLGYDMDTYDEVLKVFVQSKPGIWSELRSLDAEALIDEVKQTKERRYPSDRRVALACGIRDGNVHVEWCEEKDYSQV